MAKSKGKIIVLVILGLLIFSGIGYFLTLTRSNQEFYGDSVPDSPDLLISSQGITYKNIQILKGAGLRQGIDMCSTPSVYQGATVPVSYFPTPSWAYGIPCVASGSLHHPCCRYKCSGNYVVLEAESRLFGPGSPLPSGTYQSSEANGELRSAGTIEYCPEGCEVNGNNVYCGTNKYCVPNKKVCTGSVAQKCTADGMTINKVACEYKCESGECVLVTPSMITLDAYANSTYSINNAITIKSRVLLENSAYAGALVTGTISKGGIAQKTASGTTASNGEVMLSFSPLTTSGYHELSVKTTILGVPKEITGTFYVSGICEPYQAVCSGNTLKTCLSDGTGYKTEICSYKCSSGACVIMGASSVSVDFTTPSEYLSGDLVSFDVLVKLDGTPYSQAGVTAKVLRSGSIIAQTTGYTGSDGKVNINLGEVSALFDCQIVVIADVKGITKEVTKAVYFKGVPLTLTPTTESQIQYNLKDIEYYVSVIDSKNRYISPDYITNLKATATLTNGQVISSTAEYQGNGVYKVNSKVTGIGTYAGTISFTYDGKTIQSDPMIIDVRPTEIDVDVSSIDPSATIDEKTTYTIKFFSSLGTAVDPDAVSITISYPSGIKKEVLSLSKLTRKEEGVYTFDYTFTEVEKFTFDIYADKTGYTRSSARASVAVSGGSASDEGPGAGNVVGTIWKLRWIFIIAVILLILGLIIFRKKKRRK
jgi:hypothetical protein